VLCAANILVRYLGEEGPRTAISAAVSMCNPFDLVCASFDVAYMHQAAIHHEPGCRPCMRSMTAPGAAVPCKEFDSTSSGHQYACAGHAGAC
jgi:hypothetical protein